MTEDHESSQACCDSTVGDGSAATQSCCGESEPPTDSPRSDIKNDCCGTVVQPDVRPEEVPTPQNHDRGKQPAGGTDRDERPTSIAPNQKSGDELVRIDRAADETTALLESIPEAWQPAWSEADVATFLQEAVRERGLETAWTQSYCPAVHAGPEAAVGHVAPGARTVSPGEILHVDFGVTVDGYVADLQRVFYRRKAHDTSIPSELQTAFTDVRAALEAGRDALVPGVPGYQVDAVARHELTSRGWDAFNHAFGHQVGTIPHDRGTLLGPLWDRYGDNPRGIVRSDQVYSLELGVGTAHGYVGIEEMVRVTDDGATYLVDPQTELQLLADGPSERA